MIKEITCNILYRLLRKLEPLPKEEIRPRLSEWGEQRLRDLTHELQGLRVGIETVRRKEIETEEHKNKLQKLFDDTVQTFQKMEKEYNPSSSDDYHLLIVDWYNRMRLVARNRNLNCDFS